MCPSLLLCLTLALSLGLTLTPTLPASAASIVIDTNISTEYDNGGTDPALPGTPRPVRDL